MSRVIMPGKVSEHQEQSALIEWAKLNQQRWPELALLFAIPNGGPRHPVVAKKLQAEGVKAGVPDLCLPVARAGFLGLWIELKVPGGRLREVQGTMLGKLRGEGYAAYVCFGWESAVACLSSYLASPRTRVIRAA